MITLLFLVVTLALLTLSEKWIHRHLHGVALLVSGHAQAALYLYALLLFPGILLHELSHWLMARLLGVRTGKIRLLPEQDRNGHVRLGSLHVEQVDVARASLIGAAPLLTGSLVVLAIGYLAFDVGQTGLALLSGDLGAMAGAAMDIVQTPDMWVWLYLLFVVANAMLPSSTDRQTWPPVILFLTLVALLSYLAGGQVLVSNVVPFVAAGLRWLAVAFAITLLTDIPFMLFIALAEWGVGELRGQKVYYEK